MVPGEPILRLTFMGLTSEGIASLMTRAVVTGTHIKDFTSSSTTAVLFLPILQRDNS